MPETIHLAFPSIGVVGYPALGRYGRIDTSVSEEVKDIQIETMKYLEGSQALFGPKDAVISLLEEIAGECSEKNWDGYGAEPVSWIAVYNAKDFIRALPDGFPIPEAAPEPDGSISLEWIAPNRRVALSVGDDYRLAFAWLDGSESGNAVVNFSGINIPESFLAVAGPIVNYGKPTFRAS